MRARVYRITQMPDTLEDKSACCRGEPLRKMADKSPEMRVKARIAAAGISTGEADQRIMPVIPVKTVRMTEVRASHTIIRKQLRSQLRLLRRKIRPYCPAIH